MLDAVAANVSKALTLPGRYGEPSTRFSLAILPCGQAQMPLAVDFIAFPSGFHEVLCSIPEASHVDPLRIAAIDCHSAAKIGVWLTVFSLFALGIFARVQINAVSMPFTVNNFKQKRKTPSHFTVRENFPIM